MDKIFKSHKELTAKDFKPLWEKALFVFDTNVLLDLYRLPASAKKDLLNILSSPKVKNRIWLPFQVALEYTNNRLEVIGDQKNKFNSVKNILLDSIKDINITYEKLNTNLTNLQLKKRHSVINPDKYIDGDLFKKAFDRLDEFVKELDSLDKKQPDVSDEDELKTKISELFDGKIGSCFSVEELNSIYKEGDSRYKDTIPPGYKDADKKGLYTFEDKKITRKFGDLLLWKEIIQKAKNDKLEYIILITGDVKEDWYKETRGRKLGPRPELLNEIYFEAPSMKMFYIYDTSSFMHNAKEKLKISVKEQSITETKDLLEYHSTKGADTITYTGKFTTVKDSIDYLAKNCKVKPVYNGGLEKNGTIFLPGEMLDFILMEILCNAKNHSLDGLVSIVFYEANDYLCIAFSNRVKNVFTSEIEYRGRGIKSITELLSKIDGHIEEAVNDNTYQITLFLNKKYARLPDSILRNL